MTYAFIGESRSSSRLFLLSKIFLTWTYHKQKWLIQILGLKLSQNRSQDHFGTWYAHVKKIFDKRKKAWKKLALHRGSTGFRSQIWQQTHMHGAVLVEPNYIEVHKLWYWLQVFYCRVAAIFFVCERHLLDAMARRQESLEVSKLAKLLAFFRDKLSCKAHNDTKVMAMMMFVVV